LDSPRNKSSNIRVAEAMDHANFAMDVTSVEEGGSVQCPWDFVLMQWNLLATGLHEDGFVSSSMFGSEADLIEYLRLTGDYKELMMSSFESEVKSGKGIQNFLNRILFDQEIVADSSKLRASLDLQELERHVQNEKAAVYYEECTREAQWDNLRRRLAASFGTSISNDVAFDTLFAKSVVEGTMRHVNMAFHPGQYIVKALKWYKGNLLDSDGNLDVGTIRQAHSIFRERSAARLFTMMRTIEENKPDILTVQECTIDQFQRIVEHPDYCFDGAGDVLRAYHALGLDHQKQLGAVQEIFKSRPYALKTVNGIIMGSAIFVKPGRFHLVVGEKLKDPISPDEHFASVAEVVPLSAQCSDRSPPHVVVIAAHLASGAAERDGRTRMKQLAVLQVFLQGAHIEDANVLLGFDGNFDKVLAREGTWSQHNEYIQWRIFSESTGLANYIDVLQDTQTYGPDRSQATRDVKHVITVNKIRAMGSSQVEKWGEYQLRNIDYCMLRSAKCVGDRLSLRMRSVVNADALQVYDLRTLKGLTTASCSDILRLDMQSPVRFLPHLMPNRHSSDHDPVVLRMGFGTMELQESGPR